MHSDKQTAQLLLDSYESTQQGSLALASSWDVDVRNAEETRIPIEDCSMQRGESNTTTPDPKNDLFAESSWMCPEQNEADATFQNVRMRDKSWSDPPAQTSPAGLWIKKEIIDEETELGPNGRISGETLTKDFPGYINTNGSEVSTVDSRCHPVKSEVTAVESNCHPVKSEQTAAESICNPVVELIVIPPCQNDGDATSLDVKTEDDSPSDWSSDEEDGDSDPLGLKDGIFSEEEYRPEEDSDCGSDSDGLTGNDNTKDGEDMTPAPSVVKKEKKEKEEKEEAVVNEQADVSTKKRRYRRRKQTWRDLDKTFHCQVCSWKCSDVFHICNHLLQAHLDVVGDLVSYLKERQASSSKPGVTMYDILMPHPMVSKEQRTGRDVEGEEEMKSPELSPGDGEEFGAKTDGCGTMIHLFNDVEFVEFLQRWVKLQMYCRYCQRYALHVGICSRNGREAIHMCSIIEDPDDIGKDSNDYLCEVCGKSFSHDYLRESHKRMVHSNETGPCHICGKILRISYLNTHIAMTHKKNAQLPCGICGKSFKTRSDRDKHAAIHNIAKPFKCVYCPRRFTQLSNMKHHMRQHTGEKPYECDKCKESFTHKVSLKNHMKKKHGIDLWKMGYTGGGRPKKSE